MSDQLEIKFRLHDGSDIGPKRFPAATSVATVKESILSQWPKGPKSRTPTTFTFGKWKDFDEGLTSRKQGVLQGLHHCSTFQVNRISGIVCSEKENGPRTVNDVKLINAGKVLENSKTLGECKSPIFDASEVTTMHVVVRPPSEKGIEKKASKQPKEHKCVCVIL